MDRARPSRAALLLIAAAIAAGARAGAADAISVPPLPLPPLPGQPQPAPPARAPHSGPVRPDRPPEPRCSAAALRTPPAVVFAGPTFSCDFADPMVLKVGRAYFAYGTATGWEHRGRTFPVLQSSDLRHWRPAGDALASEPAWSHGHLWAPSVLAAHGRYFMYYSARRRRDDVHCLAVATADRPAGPFSDRGVIACGDRRAAGYIDPAPLIYRGRGYLYFSVDGPRHSISVLRLRRSLLRAAGPRRALFGVRGRWQRGLGARTVEAPWPVRRGRRFYMLYSSGCWCSDYRMGYAVARRPEGPYHDSARNPFLRGGPNFLAPGGGSVVEGPDGRAWLAFHAWTGTPSYAAGGIRTLRLAPLRWSGHMPVPLLGR